MTADKTIRLAISHERLVWAGNADTTEAAFKDAITKLAKVRTCNAKYLRSIRAVKWTLYPHFNMIPLHEGVPQTL